MLVESLTVVTIGGLPTEFKVTKVKGAEETEPDELLETIFT